MKEIIIPDLHDRIGQADKIFAHEKDFDRCVFLGDYFDGPGSEVPETIRTLEWIRNKATGENAEKFIWLDGNHNMPYVNDLRLLGFFYNSGFNFEKYKAIQKWMKENDFVFPSHGKGDYFFSQENNILFSHAGVSQDLMDEFENSKDYPKHQVLLEVFEDDLEELGIKSIPSGYVEFAIESLHKNAWKFFDKFLKDHPTQELSDYKWNWCMENIPLLYGIGSERGGYQKFGGITWADASRFVPIRGVNQVFGHTVQRPSPTLIDLKEFYGDEREIETDENDHYSIGHSTLLHKDRVNTMPNRGNSVNVALDCHLRFYAVVEHGILEIKEIDKL